MRPLPALTLISALIAACGGETLDDWQSSDLRIDGSGPEDAFDSRGVRLCRTSGGGLYVVWYDDREGRSAVWLQYSSDRGQRWLASPVRVNRGSAAATLPDLACDDDAVHVVWEDTRDGELENKNIYYNYSTDNGSTWLERDVRLSDDPNGRAMSLTPRIVRAESQVHVAWSDARNGAYDIYASSSTDRGRTFGAPVRVDSDPPGSAFSAFPQIAANGDGTVLVVWEDARDGLNDIYAATSTNAGGTFNADVRIDGGVAAGTANSFRPRISLDGDVVYAVWQDERNAPNRDIYFNYSVNGGLSWLGNARIVESDGLGAADSTNPAVKVQGGVAHVAWQDKRSGSFHVYYRSFTGGEPRDLLVEREGGEQPDTEIRLDLGARAGTSNSLDAVIDVDGEDVVVLWEDRRFDGTSARDEAAGFNEIFYNYSTDRGLSWQSNDLRLDSFCPGRKFANDIVATLDRGAVAAAWLDGRRGSSDILFTRHPLGEEGEVPPGAACAQAAAR